MEVKVNALMLRANDYGEYDKMITLLTAEEGKISAAIKGVRKAKAKLRFAAQPFCFGEYILAKSGGRYTVIGCTEIESFYDLRCDVEKFYAACAICELAGAATYEGQPSEDIFARSVRALSDICLGDEGEQLIKYLVYVLRQTGYAITACACPACGKTPSGNRVRFDMDGGTFYCHGCGSGVEASFSTYQILRSAESGLSKPTRDGIKRALRLLREYLVSKTGNQFTSLSEYIRLI